MKCNYKQTGGKTVSLQHTIFDVKVFSVAIRRRSKRLYAVVHLHCIFHCLFRYSIKQLYLLHFKTIDRIKGLGKVIENQHCWQLFVPCRLNDAAECKDLGCQLSLFCKTILIFAQKCILKWSDSVRQLAMYFGGYFC